MLVKVPDIQVLACANFAAAVQQSRKQFGSADRRQHEQQILDTFEGKVAECALAMAAKMCGYTIGLDFKLYAEGETDDGNDITTIARGTDVRVPRHRVDVKAVGSSSHWLLVEAHKYGKGWADYYVLARHQFSRDALRHMVIVSRALTDIPVEIVGVASRAAFVAPDGKPFVSLMRGSRLRVVPEHHKQCPDGLHAVRQFRREWDEWREMGPRLDAPLNYGLRAEWLTGDVGEILEYVWQHGIVED